jgi:hypothetical protein
MGAALDALVHTHGREDGPDADPILLFPVRSALAAGQDGAGAVSGETGLDEIAKLQQLRALGLPEGLVRAVPATLLTPDRQRAASAPPRELRRHPPAMRSMLRAACCWQRQQEITDTLVEFLMHIAHRVDVRAEEKVDGALMPYAKQVIGKAPLLYKLAQAAQGQPDGVVRDVIYSAVDAQPLDHVRHEAEAAATDEPQVQWGTRASSSHHARRIVPALLEGLAFQGNNDRYRPVMDALALLDTYRARKSPGCPASEQVPLDGVVSAEWQELVRDAQHGGATHRLSYEGGVLRALREQGRCKESWGHGAPRLRHPDADVPHDFAVRRDE